jgi:hypothetical protein
MFDAEKLGLEEENWNLKAELIRTRQALMQYQAKETQENLRRIADVRSAAANAESAPRAPD